MRIQLNRVIVALAVVALLLAIAGAELLRRGAGRRGAPRGVQLTARACGVRFEVVGDDELDPSGSHVVVPNDSSPLDIPAVLIACAQVRFLASAELFGNPLLAAAMRAMGTVPIARRDPAPARRQLAELASRSEPRFLAAFAGERIAPRGQRLPFKSGPFRLATETRTPIVPIAIRGSDEVLAPGSRFGVRPGTVVVVLLPPIDPASTGGDHRALRAHVERAVLDALDTAELTGSGLP